ncbi:MAG: phospho-sugar mutase [Cellulosilyticaceae bacterium]
MDFRLEFQRWLEETSVEASLKAELEALTDEKEIEDRFYQNLAFGTGGLRGKIAAGNNRINIHTVAKATQGFAAYLTETEAAPSVAIAYDSRNMSCEFAQTAASVLVANGVRVYLFDALRPTPMLSYAVRHLGASGGIVITASHNPKVYNGYKVYGSDGGQITDEAAKTILSKIDAADIFTGVKTVDFEETTKSPLFSYIGKEIDDAYYAKVEDLCIRKELIKAEANNLRIIYTPIHGSGNIPVRTMLDRLGFSDVHIVAEQELPDGNFPTAPYPNPEDKKVFELAIAMSEEISADLIFGTDPDCDRIGVVVRENDGNYRVLSGNQVGILLSDYMLSARLEEGKLEGKDAIIKTIVTSDMAKVVAKHYGVALMEVLTGFKYIGEKIESFETTGSNNFVLGFEESYGYLSGDFVRDKDAVIASVLIAEMALYYRTKGKNLYEALIDLFEKYGYYKEELISIEMEGKDGQEKIQGILNNLRAEAPTTIGERVITRIEDYKRSVAHSTQSGQDEVIDLPSSNVMKFIMADGSWFVVRPSGTEPKMKIYLSIVGKDLQDAEAGMEVFKEQVLAAVL